MFGKGHCHNFESGHHPFSVLYGHIFGNEAQKNWKCKGHARFRSNGENFTQEEFNILILFLLNEKSSYGFEIINSIEAKSEGAFVPKPESVYPTLTNLEDLGFAKLTTEENGKKIYSITESGKKYLEENKEKVEKILEILSELKDEISHKTLSEIFHSLKNIGAIIFEKHREKGWTNQQLKNLVNILEKTASEIKQL